VALASAAIASGMRRLLSASTSMLSYPTPWRETTFRRAARSSTAAGSGEVRMVTPSASAIFSASSSSAPSTTSQATSGRASNSFMPSS
jgi:hypothetical protein